MSEIVTKPHIILLKGEGVVEEYIAAGVIKPGHLVTLNSDEKLAVNSGAAAACEKMFATEDALQGRTIDTAYAADERVFAAIVEPGDHVYAFLSAGENASIGSHLSSNGDGTLQVGTTNAIAVALEAVNASDSSAAADERIRVRII